MIAAKAKYKTYLGEAISNLDETWKDTETPANQVLLRARTTKFEALLVRGWVSTDKLEVWKKVAEARTSSLTFDASKLAQRTLWDKVQALLADKDKDKSKKESWGGSSATGSTAATSSASGAKKTTSKKG